MNRDQFAAKWYQLKGRIKRRWGWLIANEVLQLNGDLDAVRGLVLKTCGDQKARQRRLLLAAQQAARRRRF